MATCVQPVAASQSAIASTSVVIVLNVRVALAGCPRSPGVSKHATTVFLCTSSPQHRSCRTSILLPPYAFDATGGHLRAKTALRAHPSREGGRQLRVRAGVRVNLIHGLAAPGEADLYFYRRVCLEAYARTASFSSFRVPTT